MPSSEAVSLGSPSWLPIGLSLENNVYIHMYTQRKRRGEGRREKEGRGREGL